MSGDFEPWDLNFTPSSSGVKSFSGASKEVFSQVSFEGVIMLSENTLLALLDKSISPEYAYLRGQIRFKGPSSLAMKLKHIFSVESLKS